MRCTSVESTSNQDDFCKQYARDMTNCVAQVNKCFWDMEDGECTSVLEREVIPMGGAGGVVTPVTPVTPATPIGSGGASSGTGTVLTTPCKYRTYAQCTGSSPEGLGSTCMWDLEDMECHSAEAGDVDAICQALDMAGCTASTQCFYDMEDMECTPNSERGILPGVPVPIATTAAATGEVDPTTVVETDAPVSTAAATTAAATAAATTAAAATPAVILSGCQGRTQAQCSGSIGGGFGCVWDYEDFECEIGVIGVIDCEMIFDPTACANEANCYMKEDECKPTAGNSEVEAPEAPEAPEYEGPGGLQKTHQTQSSTSNHKYLYAVGGFLTAAILPGAYFFHASRRKIDLEDVYTDINLENYSARV